MRLNLLLLAAMCGVLASCSAKTPVRETETGVAGGEQSGCASRAYDNIGGPIALIDQTGKAVTEADFKGRKSLVFFGFTYCPDVCPTTLVTLARALAQMPEGKAQPRVILISVDPERDTPAKLKTYLSTNVFPKDATGLTGTPEAVRKAADVFIADFSRIEAPDSAAEYTMDHTSLVYLMDEDWKMQTFFTHEDSAETISACLTELQK